MKSTILKENIMYAIKYIYQCSPIYILLVFLSAVLTSLYKIGFVYFVNILTKSVIKQDLFGFLYLSLFFFIVYIGILVINSLAQSYFLPVIENKIALCVRRDIYNSHILNPLSCIRDGVYIDNYYYAINNGKETLTELINGLGAILSSIISLFGISVIFFKFNSLIILISFAGVFISFLVSLKKEQILYKQTEDAVFPNRKIYYSNQIFYQNEYQKEIRSSNANIFFNILNGAFKEKIDVVYRWRKEITTYDFFIKSSTIISTFIVVIIIGVQTIFENYSVSVFTMLFVGLNQINNDFGQFLGSIPNIYGLTLRINKFRQFFHSEYQDGKTKIRNLETIIFSNVTFSYNDNIIFKDFNLRIENKSGILEIKGDNGSGKSTLINLLTGLEKPCHGDVFYNDVNTKELNKEDMKNLFSVVHQEPKFYQMSIIQNIILKKDYDKQDKKKVIDILKKLDLWDKIKKLENVVDTIIVDENDSNNIGFSRGELQKLAIARALYKDSDCLILDEPFNYFDKKSKEKIEEILFELSRNKMIILVSHIPLLMSNRKNASIKYIYIDDIKKK